MRRKLRPRFWRELLVATVCAFVALAPCRIEFRRAANATADRLISNLKSREHVGLFACETELNVAKEL